MLEMTIQLPSMNSMTQKPPESSPRSLVFVRPPSVVLQRRLYHDLRFVIPAKAGIQDQKHWIPGQARNDDLVNLSLKHHTRC